MKEQLKAVETFHNAFGQENGKYPRPLDEHGFNLRHSLMQEENDEYLEACFKNSLVEIADALGVISCIFSVVLFLNMVCNIS
jgi:predicted HAD superfamily Cof-like phosphohydrolase